MLIAPRRGNEAKLNLPPKFDAPAYKGSEKLKD
jgi:hypothetical protein